MGRTEIFRNEMSSNRMSNNSSRQGDLMPNTPITSPIREDGYECVGDDSNIGTKGDKENDEICYKEGEGKDTSKTDCGHGKEDRVSEMPEQWYNLRSRIRKREYYNSVEEGKEKSRPLCDRRKRKKVEHIQTVDPSIRGVADIQPVEIDESISFDDIGGLSEYINSLKEIVFLPLLYPEFFSSFNITPSRGVLLCGPPGTGKTLVARALACAASKGTQKVSFYMRKGADVLSEWVGEAEKQLRLLFEEAKKNQPSIIFFDEIDGLAPVRSSKHEQVHNSIVSTLLALMDGLDSRGQIILIGATNRVDAIDGALRRPGRFDREFNFPLPGCEARAEILGIHTCKWKQPPSKDLKLELATTCVGYCGADLKSLCTEAALHAFRERYPEIYVNDEKIFIDVDSVKVEKHHFLEAMSKITPAAHRGSNVNSRPLSPIVSSCLRRHLQKALQVILDIFPAVTALPEAISFGSGISLAHRPRILLCGDESAGLDHIGPAILHELDKFPVYSLAFQSLHLDNRTQKPEEALGLFFVEAKRTAPSILYLPEFNLWWENAHEQLKVVLLMSLNDLPSNAPILLLGTSSVPLSEMHDVSSSIFSDLDVLQLSSPSTEDRCLFILGLMEKALSIQSKHLVDSLSRSGAKIKAERHALCQLRTCLHDVCNRILDDKHFSAFHYSSLYEDDPDCRKLVHNPVDMATLLQCVDCGKYITCQSFLKDFDIILTNIKKCYGNDKKGKRIVRKAHKLEDIVHGMLSEMNPSLVGLCDMTADEGEHFSLRTCTGEGDDTVPGKAVEVAEVLLSDNKHSTCRGESMQGATMTDGEIASQVDCIKQLLLEKTESYGIPQLERLYAQILKGICKTGNEAKAKNQDLEASILSYLLKYSSDPAKL